MKMSKWISVDDELPETGFLPTHWSLPVLVWTNQMELSGDMCLAYLTCKGEWVSSDFIDGEVVLYWMPLPEPPKENK